MNKIFLKGSVKNLGDGVYEIIASTSAIDRHGDSIDQNGWDIENFTKNPVLLWAHDYSELPIGKITEIQKGKNLVVKFKFAPADANPKAGQIQKLYDDGYVNASSVGLIPKERNGHVITKAELLEISLVPVPANQEALRLAIETKSLDISLIEKDIKGEVSDELDTRSAYEKKWEKWSGFSDIVSALWGVYFDEETPVEDFSKLLSETIELIKPMASETSEITRLSINPENAVKFMDAMLEKAGRRLSKKTVENIDKSINSLKESISTLEHLKNEDDQQDSNSEEIKDEESKKVETIEIPLTDFIKSVQGHLRVADKSTETANQIINQYLKGRSINN